MLADPQIVTISGAANSMPRILLEGSKSTYQKADQNLSLVISHQNVGSERTRSMVRLDQRKVVADPLTAANDYANLGVHIVIDRPNYGFSAADIDAVVQGFKAYLTTALVTQVVGKEI